MYICFVCKNEISITQGGMFPAGEGAYMCYKCHKRQEDFEKMIDKNSGKMIQGAGIEMKSWLEAGQFDLNPATGEMNGWQKSNC